MDKLIIGLGEVLFDLMPAGKRLGGAAANIACGAAALGGSSAIISSVGKDSAGHEIVSQLSARGVDITALGELSDKPTGTVDVAMDSAGNHSFIIANDSAWDFIHCGAESEKLAGKAAVICFDSLSQRCEVSRNAIWQVLGACGANCIKIFDINLRQDFFTEEIIARSFGGADIVKVNDEEMAVVADMFGLDTTDPERFASTLCEHYSLRAAAVTLGAGGAVYADSAAGQVICQKADSAITVADTVGAGDAFVAALALSLLSGFDARRACVNAVNFASYICTISGAVLEAGIDVSGFVN